MFSFDDVISGLNALSGFASNVAWPTYNLFSGGNNRSGRGGGGGPSPDAVAAYEAELAAWRQMMQESMAFEPPDMSGWMEGLQEQMSGMFEAQQSMMNEQQAAMRAEQQKGLARQAASARKGLQERGIAYDPLSGDTGAAGSAAIASMLGIPPEELLTALNTFGSDYGWKT